jgi:glucose/arabinose dehydrogenase
MRYDNNQLSNEEIILNAIPGASNHNGGRIKFGPDNLLYIGTGDAQEPSLAQDTKSLAGKILRVTDAGKPAPGNPFGNPVYSFGHRNVQGLTWDDNGNLWATEHGRSGIQSGLDELNLIQSGKNYGWPTIQGDDIQSGMETARKNSGDTTWAPSAIAFVNDTLFFSGLRGQALYEAVLQNDQVGNIQERFPREYGRIREVILGPNNMLYISTSNNDGRGIPRSGDDKIIMVNPAKL